MKKNKWVFKLFFLALVGVLNLKLSDFLLSLAADIGVMFRYFTLHYRIRKCYVGNLTTLNNAWPKSPKIYKCILCALAILSELHKCHFKSFLLLSFSLETYHSEDFICFEITVCLKALLWITYSIFVLVLNRSISLIA